VSARDGVHGLATCRGRSVTPHDHEGPATALHPGDVDVHVVRPCASQGALASVGIDHGCSLPCSVAELAFLRQRAGSLHRGTRGEPARGFAGGATPLAAGASVDSPKLGGERPDATMRAGRRGLA
jgi:hypothetical protein